MRSVMYENGCGSVSPGCTVHLEKSMVRPLMRAGVPVLLVPGGSSTAEELGRTGQRLLRSFAELRVLLPGPAH